MSNSPSKKILNFLLAFILAGAIFTAGFYFGEKRGGNNDGSSSDLGDFITVGNSSRLELSLFWTVYGLVSDKYIDRDHLDSNDLVYGAIKGMVDALDDPHSFFMDPEETKEFNDSLDNVYEGIGAYVGLRDDQITITSPLKDSPAAKAGVQAGDKILKIDDKTTEDLSLDQAVSLLRGEKGTKVKLTLLREGENDLIEIEVERAVVNVPSVEWEKKGDGIVHFKLNKFEKNTYEEAKKEAQEILKDPENKKIILDLRNNTGGYFDEAINLTGLFIGKGKVAVIEEQANGDREEYETKVNGLLADLPVVVLVNESSASAAEILAGAARDQVGVLLVGKKTYGKGSVQEYKELEDGSSLKITVAKWLTPNGTQIDEQGLEVDKDVELTPEDLNNDRDPQLDKAIEIIKGM